MKQTLSQLKYMDFLTILCVISFTIISLMMMTSVSLTSVNSRLFFIQSISYIIGYITWLGLFFVDFSFFRRHAITFLILALLTELLCYTPLGVTINDSKSWIDLKITYFQPSEIMKIFFVIALASFIVKAPENLDSFFGFLKILLFASPMILIVAKEDLGTGIVMMVGFITIVFAAGINRRLFLKLSIGMIVLIPIVFRFLAPHQKERIDAFLHPDNTSIEANYQVWQSKISMGSGGIFGKGLGQGEMKNLNFLPVKESDFIFSVLVEELGFIGGAILIVLFIFLSSRLLSIANKASEKDNFYGIIVMGLSSMLIFQSLENILMTMGLMPVTGITLPFISAGGSGILSNMIALGIILNIGIKTKGLTFQQ